MKLLLYCTKGKPYLLDLRRVYEEVKFDIFKSKEKLNNINVLNGKIVAECDYEMEDIFYNIETDKFTTNTLSNDNLMKTSCLNNQKYENYLLKSFYDYSCSNESIGNAIYIKNLHVFDTPRKLNNYYKFVGIGKMGKECINNYISIKKAPQNMMYIFDGNEKKVLISIHPEHLCKILNGEKTIEVRKKVLKCM